MPKQQQKKFFTPSIYTDSIPASANGLISFAFAIVGNIAAHAVVITENTTPFHNPFTLIINLPLNLPHILTFYQDKILTSI